MNELSLTCLTFSGTINLLHFTPLFYSSHLVVISYFSFLPSHFNGANVNGNVNVVVEPALLSRARNDILRNFAYVDLHTFNPTWLMIVTWSDVTFMGGYLPTRSPTVVRIQIHNNYVCFRSNNQSAWQLRIYGRCEDAMLSTSTIRTYEYLTRATYCTLTRSTQK